VSGNGDLAGWPAAAAPELLEAAVGDPRHGYWLVRLVAAGTLAWTFESGYPNELTEMVTPDRAAWARFAAELEQLAVFGWQRDYGDASGLDATHWVFACSWAGRRVESSGASTFPPRFDELCEALERLLGGRTFHWVSRLEHNRAGCRHDAI
jgi:hypothetical protein